jgi:hypothetical protein
MSGVALGAKGKDYIIKNYDVMNLFFMFDLFERKNPRFNVDYPNIPN